ncbi:Leukemia inhibitory factor receptor [Mizuhopecten yessoensis]|uniref:Leukemia inhibitory factor receptor n=1 Tax=Mizuhopecten yessoensis TaxID=6573 RepID=A0A210PTY1_MIZYE|nr:Leukemia inhibitory factor receptor [Mizuhopecten yessoensis]
MLQNNIYVDIPPEPLYFHCMISLSRVNCYFLMHDSCVEWTLRYHLSGEEDLFFHGKCSSRLGKSPQCVDVNDEDHSYRNLMRKCRDSHREEIETTCPLSDAVRDEVYWVQLEGRSPYGMSSFAYNVTTNITIERLGPLRNFRVESTTSTSVTLTWYFPNNPAHYSEGISCNIIYYTNDNTTQNQTKLWKTGKNVRYSLNNLEPYRNHTVEVSCRFSASRYWSKSSSVKCTTEQDVPIYGPNATLTSYTVYQNINRTYTVTLYIKPPHVDTINGILQGYELQLFSLPNSNDNVTVLRYAVSSTLIIENVPPGTKELYTNITSLTVAGRSRNSLQLNISMEPNEDIFRVEAVSVNEYPDHHHFLVSIRHNTLASSDNIDITYIYHWCQTNASDYDCNDRKIIKCLANYDFAYSIQTQRTIVVKRLSSQKYSWVFGASIALPVPREGLRWETCTLPYGWSNNSTTYSTENKDRLLGLLVLAGLVIPLIMIGVYIWKKYRHYCNAYDIELPEIENEDYGLRTTHLTLKHQPIGDEPSDQHEKDNSETKEIGNSEYSRLHPDDIEGRDVLSKKESSTFMGLDIDKDNVDGEITCREKYDKGEERGQKEINHLNEHVKHLSEWTVCQIQEGESNTNNLSNYEDVIPGETPRAAPSTPRMREGKTNKLRRTTDDFERLDLKSMKMTHVCLTRQPSDDIPADQWGTEKFETGEIDGNTGYSRLHHVYTAISVDNATVSDQEPCPIVGFDRDIKCLSSENAVQDNGQEQKQNNQRNNVSHYVLTIPGDTHRAVRGTPGKQSVEDYRHHSATDEFGLSGLETENSDLCKEHASLTCQHNDDKTEIQFGTGIREPNEIRNTDEFRLLPAEDPVTRHASDKHLNLTKNFDKDMNSSVRKIVSSENDEHEEQNDKNISDDFNNCSKNHSECASNQEHDLKQEKDNKKSNMSNYVLTIPGDTHRTVRDTPGKHSVNEYRHYSVTDGFGLSGRKSVSVLLENGDLCKEHVSLTCQPSNDKADIQLGTRIVEPNEITNADNSRLHPGEDPITRTSETVSDKHHNLTKNFDKDMDNSVREVVSSENDKHEEQNDDNISDDFNKCSKNYSECTSSQEHDLKQEKDNKRNNMSNYVQHVPGDTARAATRTDHNNCQVHVEES